MKEHDIAHSARRQPYILPNFVNLNFNEVKDLVFSIARTLLNKNIPFCIYRFPFGDDLNIGLKKGVLPNETGKVFWLAPFVQSSSAHEVFFDVIPGDKVNHDLVKQIESLPGESFSWSRMPAYTGQKTYFEQVEKILKEIRQKHIRKAVLSRIDLIEKRDYFDPLKCFKKLCSRHKGAFVHLLFHQDAGLWLGATPELLLLKNGSEYKTMALAGTQPLKKGNDYHWRKKELQEQEMVQEHIESVFSKFGCKISFKHGPLTVEAGPVVHLKTDYEFEETSPVDLKKLLARLHPTPAVGGLPVAESLKCIHDVEGYDRKYYAGFIGETDFSNYARLYMNLRCMQVGKEKIAVYCGGGITAGSDPREEWDETKQKCKTMLDTMVDLHENETVR